MSDDIPPAQLCTLPSCTRRAQDPQRAGSLCSRCASGADGAGVDDDQEDVDERDPADDHATDRPDDRVRWSGWDDTEFNTPESGIWPEELLGREQWMGHSEKKPFAPWGDQNPPIECTTDDCPADRMDDKRCDCDGRWKWGYIDHYVDGETVAMAEVDPRLDGRAFLQQEDDPYAYVDGDDVRDPESGEVHPAFIAFLEHLGTTYADISTSGAGVHAQYCGELPDGVKQASWQLDDEPWGDNDEPPSIEIYARKRVCVATGEHVPGTPTEIREWNDDALDAIVQANDDVASSQRDAARDSLSTAREDYDLDSYDAGATSSDETTDDIRDVFAAIDRIDARRVAEHTIVHRWNDSASTSNGERAFAPTWGPNSNGTANIVNDQRWMDTGDLGGYGGPVTMAAVDAGEVRPSSASPVNGKTWWRGVEHLRELGFDIPEYESSTPDTGDGVLANEWPIETCTPPKRDADPFDHEERWDELQGERFDDVLDHNGIDLWGDEAGAGKTTNFALGALEREQPHVIYFDKHEKAREFITDSAIQDFESGRFQDAEYFHLKGGAQKQMGYCMDADHADEDCSEHGHPSNCPSMCPVYDLDEEHETRQAYEALIAEVGPNKAHQILELHEDDIHPWHGGECAWQAQYSQAENATNIVGVHPYITQQSVRETGLNIIDETPDLHSRETTVDIEDLTRIANTMDRVAELRPRDDPVSYTAADLAQFARDVVDVITDTDNSDDLSDLAPPTVTWSAYETYDQAAGNYVEREQPEEDWHLAEALAKAKVAHGETVLTRMQNDDWEGTPISIDPLLAAGAEAGLDIEPIMQAVALSPVIDVCPWCRSDLEHAQGARYCSSDTCDWHEAENSLIHQDAEAARGQAWLHTDRNGAVTSLRYRELPLVSELPEPEDTAVLDATATPAKVAALFGVDQDDVRVAGDEPLEVPKLRTTQVIDGQYHAGTIRTALEEDRTLAERIQRSIDTAADIHEKPLFVVKSDLIPEFDFPDHGEVLHYYATRGLNRTDCDAVMCIGAPHPDVEDLRRDAGLLAMNDDVDAGGAEHSTRSGAPNPPVYRKLHYEDDQGRGRAVPTKHYTGMVGTLFRESREKELIQALHRIRPLLADAPKHAYLVTNVPTEIPVDELATFEEFADPLQAMLPIPDGAVDLLAAVDGALSGDAPDGFRPGQLVEERDGVAANKVAGYHRLAQLSGLDVSKRTVYEWVHALEDVGLLQPEEYEQQAGVSYAVDTATLNSALSVLSHNGGFKVAAQRRFRRFIDKSGSGLDWLAWARDVFDLGGTDNQGDRPPTGGQSGV